MILLQAMYCVCVYVCTRVCANEVEKNWEKEGGVSSFYGYRCIIHFIAIKCIFSLLCHQKNH